MLKVTNKNYFDKETNMQYMSASQLKDFIKCPACAMAKLKGEYEPEKSTALLIGSYVDAYYEGTLDKFKEENPEIFKKDGTLKSEYIKADSIIQKLTGDEMFSKYMSGEKQVIMTGNILDVPFKIKIDSYHEHKCIVDLKIMKDMAPIWNGHEKVNFVEYYGYDIQMAIYQQIVYENTGEKLPTFLCVGTKENVTDLAILEIDNERLDYVMEGIIKPQLGVIQAMKNGNQPVISCGHCDYCIQNKKLDKIINYKDLDLI